MFKHELGRKLLMGCGYKKKADSQWERIGLECSHVILPALRRCPACLEILDTQCSHILPLMLTGCQYFCKTSLRASDERCFFWPVSSTNEKKENGLLQSFFFPKCMPNSNRFIQFPCNCESQITAKSSTDFPDTITNRVISVSSQSVCRSRFVQEFCH